MLFLISHDGDDILKPVIRIFGIGTSGLMRDIAIFCDCDCGYQRAPEQSLGIFFRGLNRIRVRFPAAIAE